MIHTLPSQIFKTTSFPIKVAVFDTKTYDRKSFLAAAELPEYKNKFEFHFFEPRLDCETAQFCSGFIAVCVFVNDDLNPEVLAILDELGIRLILLRCAGFDRVDIRAAHELDLTIARVPAYSPNAVAEFAVALLLTLVRKTHKAYNRVRDGNFTLQGLVGFDLYKKVVGVVGTGKIGFYFIKIMLGFGCKILAHDMYQNPEVLEFENVKYTTLDEIYKNADIISLHIPASPSTNNMINYHAINLMKPGVVIVNTSRGALIDAKALVDGLITQRIGGAALDVYENEQDYFFRDVSESEIEDNVLARLQNMRNVLITSHQAFLTNEALEAIAETTLKNLYEYFVEGKSGNNMTNYVKPPQINPAIARRLSRKSSIEFNTQNI